MTMDLFYGEAFLPSAMKAKGKGPLHLKSLEVCMGETVRFFPTVLGAGTLSCPYWAYKIVVLHLPSVASMKTDRRNILLSNNVALCDSPRVTLFKFSLSI